MPMKVCSRIVLTRYFTSSTRTLRTPSFRIASAASEAPKSNGDQKIASAISKSSWMSCPIAIHFTYSTEFATSPA